MGSTDELCEDKVRSQARIVNLTLLEQEAILTNIDPCLWLPARGGEGKRRQSPAAALWFQLHQLPLVKLTLSMGHHQSLKARLIHD